MPNIICRDLSFAYDGSETKLFSDLDLTIDTHWRAALVGANGRGKTTLLRLLARGDEAALAARERIERALLDSAVSLIFVEHDAHFVERLATATVKLKPPARGVS